MSNSVPEGWKESSIGEITATDSLFCDGDWVESKDQDQAGLNRLIQLADVGDGLFVNKSSRYMNDEQFDRLKCTALKRNDILIARMPDPLGRACLYPLEAGRAATVVDVAVIRTPHADHYWLMSAINSSEFRYQIDLNASGTTRTRIARGVLSQIKILQPPLPEQQKIAAILSSVDDVIEKTRAQIGKLKDLKTGMMQELLTKGIGHTAFKDSPVGRIPEGWYCVRLGDALDFKNGVNKGKEAFGHGVPIISYKNVYSGGGINDSDLNALVDMNEKELDRFRVRFGDVFFTRTSETPDEIGFANVYLGSRDDVVFNGFVIRGRQNRKLFETSFLKYAFQSNSVRKQMMDNSKFTTRAGISGESLSRVLIAIPDIAEQEKIANALGMIDSRISSSNEKLKSVMSLKRALMQDLLTGKIRVNVDNKENAVA